jgi:hypothetical protein
VIGEDDDGPSCHDGCVLEPEDFGIAMKQAGDAITEGRDTVQGLRASTVQTNDLARAINTLGEELARKRSLQLMRSLRRSGVTG